MTKSELFTAAHKIAKDTVSKVGNYMIALSLALKSLYRGLKMDKPAERWSDAEVFTIHGTFLAFNTLEEATVEFNKRDAAGKWCQVSKSNPGTATLTTVLSNHARKKAEYDAEMDDLIASCQ